MLLQRIDEYLSEETEKLVNADEINNTVIVAKELREILTSETVKVDKQVALMKELHALVCIQSQELESADAVVTVKLCKELDSVLNSYNIVTELGVTEEIKENLENVDTQTSDMESQVAVVPEPNQATEVESTENISIGQIVEEIDTDKEERGQDFNFVVTKDLEVEQTEILEEEGEFSKAKSQNETVLEFEEPLATEALIKAETMAKNGMAPETTQLVIQGHESNILVDVHEQILSKELEIDQSDVRNIIEQTIENTIVHEEDTQTVKKAKDVKNFAGEEFTQDVSLPSDKKHEKLTEEELPVKETNIEEKQEPETSNIESRKVTAEENITEIINEAEIYENDGNMEIENLVTEDKSIGGIEELKTISVDEKEEKVAAENTKVQQNYSEIVINAENKVEPNEVVKAEEITDEVIQISDEFKQRSEEEALQTVEPTEAVAVTEVEVIEDIKTEALTDNKEDTAQLAVSIGNMRLRNNFKTVSQVF